MKKETKSNLALYTLFFFALASSVSGFHSYELPPAVLEEDKFYTPHPKVVKRK